MAIEQRSEPIGATAPVCGRIRAVEAIDRIDSTDGVLDEFVLELTHELLPPLKAIQWLAETVGTSGDRLSPDDVQRCMESIMRSARYLGSLIDHFAGRRSEVSVILERRVTDLSALITQTAEDMAGILGPHPLRVSVEGEVVATVDPTRTREVLVNLLANAAKFSSDGAPISIEMRAKGPAVEVTVADHCPGIPLDKRARVFERYARLGDIAEGMGLGLYFARGIAKAHGGDLTVSPGDSGGCRFTLTLPR